MSTISVVIPTYNRAALVSGAIESALSQSVRPGEVIVVDDGSDDDTGAVVARFGSAVRYIRQANAGVGAARNRGAGEATGEWVAFLDSDDTWERDKLALQLAALGAVPGAEWSLTDFTVVDGQDRPRGDEPWSPRVFGCLAEMGTTGRMLFGRHLERRRVDWTGGPVELFTGDLFPLLFHGNLGLPSSLMVRRERFQESGGFDSEFRVAEETEFLHRFSVERPVVLLMAPLTRYRVADGPSLINTGDPRPAIRNALRSMEQASRLRAPHDEGDQAVRRAGEARLRLRLAHAALSVGDPGEARSALAALPAGSWSIRRAALTGLSLLPPSLLRAALSARRGITR
jgi:hypothetical protein